MARDNIDFYYQNLGKHAAEGQLDHKLQQLSRLASQPSAPTVPFRKYVVLDVILDTAEVLDNITSYLSQYLDMNVLNITKLTIAPRNSIVGQPLEVDGGGPSMILFPFFPSHLSLPCKPGELVWVVFEHPEAVQVDVGYWMCRVPDLNYVDDPNHTHFPRKWDPSLLPSGARDKDQGTGTPQFEFRNGAVTTNDDGERVTVPESRVIFGPEAAFETIVKSSIGSQVCVPEAVPRFNKRPGDTALEGSNNTLISLGTDRNGPVGTYDSDSTGFRTTTLPTEDQKSGAIDLVAGRGQTEKTAPNKVTNTLGLEESDKSMPNVNPREGDPDLLNDRSRILVTVGTGRTVDVQLNPGLNDIYTKVMTPAEVTQSTPTTPGAAVIKSDVIRMVARAEIVIVSTNYDVKDGKMMDKVDAGQFACVILKPNGDIILRPATKGLIKLGDETADRALLCTDLPAVYKDGVVSPATPPLSNTMGGKFGGTQIPSQGTWAKKILVTGAK